MKKREAEETYRSPRLSASNVNDPESFKVRKGTIGQHLEFFDKKEHERINRIMMEELDDIFTFTTKSG